MTEGLHEIKLLAWELIVLLAADLAEKADQRRRTDIGRVDRNRCIGRARTAARENDARLAGDRAVGERHISRAAFVPAGNRANFRIVIQRVKKAEIALARDTEKLIDAVERQGVEKYIR
jgi:hypothetical protein